MKPFFAFALPGLCPSFAFALRHLRYDGKKTQMRKTGERKTNYFPVLQALPDNLILAAHAIIVNIFIKLDVVYETTSTIGLSPIVTISQ
ncbi:hypothetical protein [uncultured Bartonella sp.]|uniref:hypothetical protein n=1 Tax=uncultured Bartonella sp. TaxID=104108 RepID=UPI0025F4C118|nr:hypothetical protein [uncultured Bartonella sp.]